jgi:probable HAF family extracellular repeat protein
MLHSTASAQSTLVDVGVATAHAINNNGQVALDQGIYTNGTIAPLPALPGGTTPAVALAINANAQVAGSASLPAQPNISNAILYSGGTLANIGANFVDTGLGIEPAQSLATSINTSGVVVGYYLANSRDSIWISFTYTNGTVTQIPVPCSPTSTQVCTDVAVNQAAGIDDAGDIVGTIVYNNNELPYLADAYVIKNGVWTDLGPGSAYAINASGQVAGTLTSYTLIGLTNNITGTIAFLYASGAMTKLGTLPGGQNSTGYALNSSGQVVGASDFTGSKATHAFFDNGVMTDMNSMVSPTDPLQPFVTLSEARGINDSGLIVANGVDSRTGLKHAYLMQVPVFTIAPGPLSFANTAVGASSQPQQVTVTNSGATALLLGTLSVSSDFSETNSCGPSLGPGGQCTAMVTYVPLGAGTAAGGLTIPAAGVNYVVPLSGVAPIAASITGSAATLNIGQSLTLSWNASPGSSCTAGSSASSPFNGASIQPSGQMTFTQTSAGTVVYQISCTAPGVAEAISDASVVWTYPAVTTTLSASPTTITTGGSTTLTWSSTNATSCTGSRGGVGDSWPGTKPASGTQTVTESYALATSSVALAFTITCTASASGNSSKATANVTENAPPTGKSGGGGAFDFWTLLALGSLFIVRKRLREAGQISCAENSHHPSTSPHARMGTRPFVAVAG